MVIFYSSNRSLIYVGCHLVPVSQINTQSHLIEMSVISLDMDLAFFDKRLTSSENSPLFLQPFIKSQYVKAFVPRSGHKELTPKLWDKWKND